MLFSCVLDFVALIQPFQRMSTLKFHILAGGLYV
jgi:hypothetical protein